MSDQWGTTETNATGVPPPPPPGGRGGSGFGGNITIADPGFGKIADAISQLTAGMQDLQQTMAGFSQSQHQMSSGVVNTFQNVSTSATTATDSIKTFFQALGGNRPGGSSMASILNYGLESKLGRDIALFPLRYMQSTIGSNRQFALDISGAMSSQQYATGIPTNTAIGPFGGAVGPIGMYTALGKTFGSGTPGIPTGTGQEITQFLNIARQAGAMVDLDKLAGANLTGGTGQNPRAPGFVQAAYQMQQMYPSMGLGEIGKSLGGFAANSAAQRQGVMLTGGAFSMIKGGGKMKSIDEWAETIFRWLENQRPGPKRGTGFTYDELISQQYPGSNISAWFEANAVPADMQEVWWNYALAKARTSTSGTTIGPAMASTAALPTTPNLATSRLASTQPLTQTSFNLAGAMGGAYANRELVNRDFNRMIGGLQQRILPAAAGSVLGFTQAMADPIEELMMSILERSGNFGAGVGGALGWGALGVGGFSALIEGLFGADTSAAGGVAGSMGGGLLFSGLPTTLLTGLQEWLAESLGRYEVGDIGDSDIGEPWSPEGATTASSLHPSVSRKVNAMMKANPRLRVNSGRRDEALQRKLKRQGYKNVSGKSSAHTRGLAADLGPRSEYGWLTKNAHKFGLKSGAGVGEPWHVGMPGVGDSDIGEAGPDTGAVNDTATTGTTTAAASTATTAAVGGLGALFGLFGGLGGEDYMTTVQNSMPGLFNLMFGGFASDAVANKPQKDIDKALAYDPDYAKKVFAATSYKTGGVYGGGNIWDKILAAAKARNAATFGTQAAPQSVNVAGGTGSETLSGALSALGLASTGLSDGAMVALLANKAGFTGTDLTAAVAISERESGFQPTAHRSDVDKALMRGDRGLWQINAGAWNDLLMEQGFIKDPLDRAIFDPWVNAQIARMIWQRSSNFSAWTMGPNGWDPNGDPFYGTDRNAAEGYVKEAGLGDSDYYPESPAAAVSVGPRTMNFNNTFVVQGGGGNQGIDTRRVVNMLADQLEGEMRRRMARSN